MIDAGCLDTQAAMMPKRAIVSLDWPMAGSTIGYSISREVERRMDKAENTKYRRILEDKRDDVIKRARATMAEDMRLDMDDLADELDLASSEYIQSFTFRLRGRDRIFLQKIDRALKKLENGDFGMCEDCGEPINEKRLEARPETTLCIKCKEDQERHERDYG